MSSQTQLDVLVAAEVARIAATFPPPADARPRVGGFWDWVPDFGGFSDPAWLAYKEVWGVTWDRVGEFDRGPPSLSLIGDRDYFYRPDPAAPFSFTRASGETVTPGEMHTDGGTIPRIVWSIPGLDPWKYIWAYLIHDWDYECRHADPSYPRSFEQVNDTLGEGIYTLMVAGAVPEDWRTAAVIHAAVSSFIGRDLWNS